MIGVMEDGSERKSAEAALTEELRNTKILHDLSARLVTEENIQTVYEEILSAAIEITQAAAGTVQMLDAETEELVVLATRGFSQETTEYFHRVDASSNTSCGLALRTGNRAYLDFDPASTNVADRKHVEDGVRSAQSSPLVSRSGKPIGMVSTHWGEPGHRLTERGLRFLDLLARQAADLIEQRHAEIALRESEERRELALQAADMGTWDHDLVADVCHFDERAKQMYALPSDTLDHRPQGVGPVVHPDDAGPMFDEIRKASDPNGDGRYDIDYRIAQGDGSYRWLRAWGKTKFEGQGAARRAVRIVGATRDITAEKEAERQRGLLQAVSMKLVSTQQPEALYQQLLDAGMALMKADAASVQILDPDRLRLRLLASRNFHPDSEIFWHWVDASHKSTCAIALEKNERVLIENVETSPELAGSQDLVEYRRSGLKSVQSTPLLSRDGKRLGMFSTHWRKPHQPASGDFGLFDVLARQAADLIERAHGEAPLRESEEKYRTLFERIDEGFCIIELVFDDNDKPIDYKFIAVNPAFERHTGIVAAQGRMMKEIAPDYEQHWFDCYGEVALTGVPQRFQAPAKALGERYYDVNAFRIGQPSQRWVAIVFSDITQRQRDAAMQKELAERQQVLVQELQHRTRNLLGVVQSITNRTLEASNSLETFSKSFRERLAALARVNGLLSRLAEGDRITFDELIRTELSGHGIPCGKPDEGQIRLSGPENVRLRSSTVQTLALGLHELTTNAVKYGALSKPEGQLSIRWSVENGAGERRLKVRWQENGVPPELDGRGETQRKGYGRELIEQALPYQLKAETTYEITPDGVRCTISLPISTT